jgi:hypothetical protein
VIEAPDDAFANTLVMSGVKQIWHKARRLVAVTAGAGASILVLSSVNLPPTEPTKATDWKV